MSKHISVLLKQTIDAIKPSPGGIYVDATLGGGGHSKEIIKRINNNGTLIAFDVDDRAISRFKEEINSIDKLKVYLFNKNFDEIDSVLKSLDISGVNGIIADLGLSTDQIDEVEGISYVKESELDMRMDKNLGVKASDLLNGMYYKELVEMFSNYGDVTFAKRLSKEIVEYRKSTPFKTTTQLKHLIQKIVPYSMRKGTSKNPEAKVFQALRIAVNDELNTLRRFLPLAFEALLPEASLAVISFHSGEDRIVKNFGQNIKNENKAELSEVIYPSEREQNENKRSSSAKLRIITKK